MLENFDYCYNIGGIWLLNIGACTVYGKQVRSLGNGAYRKQNSTIC